MQDGRFGGYHVPPGYKLATVLVPQYEEPFAQDVVEYSSYQNACKRSIVADFTSELGVCLRRHDQPAQKPAEGARRGPRSASSKFRGVTRHRRTKRWESHIWHQRQQRYLGGFGTEAHAGKAHDIMALKCRGRHGNLNFPLSTYASLLDYMDSITQDEVVAALRHQNKSLLKPNTSGQDGSAESSPSQTSNPSQETSSGEVMEVLGGPETPSSEQNESHMDLTTCIGWSNQPKEQPSQAIPSAQGDAAIPSPVAPPATARPSLVGKLQASLQQHSPRSANRVRSGFAVHTSRPLPPWETPFDSPTTPGAVKHKHGQHSFSTPGNYGANGKATAEPSVLTFRSLSDANSNVLLGRPVNVPPLTNSPPMHKNEQLQYPHASMAADCRASSYASSFTSMFDDLSPTGELPLSFDTDAYRSSSSALADLPRPLTPMDLQLPSLPPHSTESYMRSSSKDTSPVDRAFSPLMSLPIRGLNMPCEARPLTPNASCYASLSSAMAVIPTATVVVPPQRTSPDAEALWGAPPVLAPMQPANLAQPALEPISLNPLPLEHSPEQGRGSAGSYEDSWDPTAVWNY